jgi:hypothetical protein
MGLRPDQIDLRGQARSVSVQHQHQAEQVTAHYKAHFIKREAAVEWREK